MEDNKKTKRKRGRLEEKEDKWKTRKKTRKKKQNKIKENKR